MYLSLFRERMSIKDLLHDGTIIVLKSVLNVILKKFFMQYSTSLRDMKYLAYNLVLLTQDSLFSSMRVLSSLRNTYKGALQS